MFNITVSKSAKSKIHKQMDKANGYLPRSEGLLPLYILLVRPTPLRSLVEFHQ